MTITLFYLNWDIYWWDGEKNLTKTLIEKSLFEKKGESFGFDFDGRRLKLGRTSEWGRSKKFGLGVNFFLPLSLSLSHSHTHSHIYLLYSVSSPPTLSRRYTHQRHTNYLSLLSPFSLYNPLSLSLSLSPNSLYLFRTLSLYLFSWAQNFNYFSDVFGAECWAELVFFLKKMLRPEKQSFGKCTEIRGSVVEI